jgi:ornithine carbamoyltransferase
MKIRHLVSITDLTSKEIIQILDLADKLKSELKIKGYNKPLLERKTLVMIYEKPSLRTRLSFEIGMTQLGGHAIYLGPSDISMGTRESVSDIAKVTSSMGDIIMARTFAHKSIIDLAKYSSVPVINGLSDMEHPCQILADIMTIREVKKKLKGLTIAYVGDCENNVVHSFALASYMLGMKFRCAAPKGYEMNKVILKKSKALQLHDPIEAVANADVIVTDTWVSMGDEAEKETRLKILGPYQVNYKLMAKAKKGAIFLHCLPAYRGNEVTADVIDGTQSFVFQEAENRLHAQKALMLFLLNQV